MNELDKMLVDEIRKYRREIRPLHPDDGDGSRSSYTAYDEAYNVWLEGLHGRIEYYLKSKGLLEE